MPAGGRRRDGTQLGLLGIFPLKKRDTALYFGLGSDYLIAV
jgi:hypothetical protein